MKLHLPTIAVLSVGIAIFLVADGVAHLSSAQVRSSTNYQLQSDSINVGGGLSSSTNYVQESTVGEIATGRSSSSNFSLQAGYQQMQEVYLSLAGGADIIMDPDLPGISGGTSNGSTTFTVITDSPAGYELTIQAEDDPAMQQNEGGGSIANYPGSLTIPEYNFTVPAGQAYFGYTAEGVDIRTIFLDDGADCNSGVNDTPNTCWVRMRTAPNTVSVSSGSNHPNGATTTIGYRVGIASGAAVESGVYTATTTVTALPL